MKRFFGPGFRILSLAVVALLSAWYFGRHHHEFAKLLHLKWYQYASIGAIMGVEIFIYGLILRTLMKHFGIRLKRKEAFAITIVGMYSNYLFVRSSALVKGIYLKSAHGLGYRKFVAIFFFSSLIQIALTSYFSAITLLLFSGNSHLFSPFILIFFLVIAAGAVIPFLAPAPLLRAIVARRKSALWAVDGWLRIRGNARLIAVTTLYSALVTLLNYSKIYLISNFFIKGASFAFAVIITSTGILSSFISVTPGAIGVREALMSTAAKMIGESFVVTTTIASLDRLVAIAITFTLGPIFSIWYSKAAGKKRLHQSSR